MTAIPRRRLPAKEAKLISNIKKDSVTRRPVDRLFNCWEKTSIVVNVEFMMKLKYYSVYTEPSVYLYLRSILPSYASVSLMNANDILSTMRN